MKHIKISVLITPTATNVNVISNDTYPFLPFSDLTCQLEDTGIGVFWLHCAA